MALGDIDDERPRVRAHADAGELEIECELIAACDGFHGLGRAEMPSALLRSAECSYPYAWLGILADAPPSCDELIYCHSERGFALHSMRSPRVSLYLQVDPDERVEDWPDRRIWDELHLRLAQEGRSLTEGPILEKRITPMHSFVAWPMRHGRLFLAGDAAQIVPPTGAKGLNLAAWDVRVLGEAILASFEGGDEALFDSFRRVWRAQDFSYWMTTMPHTEPEDPGGYNSRLQLARLAYVCSSESAARSLAENYAISRSASPTARFPRWGSTLTKGIKTSRLASATSRTSSF